MSQTCDLTRVPASGKDGPFYPVTWAQAVTRCRPTQRIVVEQIRGTFPPRVLTSAGDWTTWLEEAGSFFDLYYVDSAYLGGRAGAGEGGPE